MQKKISVVGLGKLGLPLAVSFASRGFRVLGIDINNSLIEALNRGVSPIVEPHLQETLSKYRRQMSFSTNAYSAMSHSNVTIILVATPSDSWGCFSNKYLETALVSLAKAYKEIGRGYHTFVISSTVMPTTIESVLIPLLEKHSGKKINRDFGVCFVPDFVALGKVINDFTHPDFVLVGQSNQKSGKLVEDIYSDLRVNNAPIARLSLVNAEIAKVSLNNYITTKITFANSLANLCERIPGANVDEITRVIGKDKRISPYYLKGGLGFGGTCFPRDVHAWIALAKKYKTDVKLQDAVRELNDFQEYRLYNIILNELKKAKTKTVSILGMAFKQDTPVIIESSGVKLANRLLKEGVKVTVYDTMALENVKAEFGDKLEYASSVKACINSSSICAVVIPDKQFIAIKHQEIKKSVIIVDCWRIMGKLQKNKKVNYYPLGMHRNV
jgi:UDPglucose 6-dehydrogenase